MSQETKEKIIEKDLGERLKNWYESYDNCPPWSSVLGFIVRETKFCQKAKQEERERIRLFIENERNKEAGKMYSAERIMLKLLQILTPAK